MNKHTIFDTPVVNRITRVASLIFLRIIGWRPGGEAPKPKKHVLIAAPHTSNWDLLLMIALAFLFRVKLYWMGKDRLFWWPLGPVLKYLGGIPIDRSKPTGMVGQSIEKFQESERLVIAVPPEGTRGKVRYWKSGFYHIARGANVPIVLGFLDYSKKVGGFGPAIVPTGDLEADMAVIRDFYADIGAKYPEQKSCPRLAPPK